MPLHHAAPKAAFLAALGAPAPAQGGARFATLLQQAGQSAAGHIPKAGTAAHSPAPAALAAPSIKLAAPTPRPTQAAPARVDGARHHAASPASILGKPQDQPATPAMPMAARADPPVSTPLLAERAASSVAVVLSRDVQHGPAVAAPAFAAAATHQSASPQVAIVEAALRTGKTRPALPEPPFSDRSSATGAPRAPNRGEAATQPPPLAAHSNVNVERASADARAQQAPVSAPSSMLQPAAMAPKAAPASTSVTVGAEAALSSIIGPASVQTPSTSVDAWATAAGASSDRQVADRRLAGPGPATANIIAATSAPSSQPASAQAAHTPTLTTIAAVLAAADTPPGPGASPAAAAPAAPSPIPAGSPADVALAAALQTPALTIFASPNVSPAPSAPAPAAAAPARPRSSFSTAPVAASPVQNDATTPPSEPARAPTQPVTEQPTGEQVSDEAVPSTAPETPGGQVPDAARSTAATSGKAAAAEPAARHAAEQKTASDHQASATADGTTPNALLSAPAANTQVPAATAPAEAGTHAVTSTSAASASGQASAQAQAHAPPAAQLAQSVAALHMAGAGARQVTINLTPGTLGAVQVHIARGQDGASVITLQVEKPETLRTLQQDSAHLHQALDRAGLPSAGRQVSYELAQGQAGAGQNNAGVSAGGGGSDGQNRRAPQPQSQPAIGQDAEPRGGLGERAPTPMRTRPAGASGINITA